MKLYGLKIDKNEKGEEVALVELTRKEVANLMDFANESSIFWHEKNSEICERIARKYWMQLYDIKYSQLWKDE